MGSTIESNIEGTGGEEDLSKYQGDEGFVLRWLKEIELVKNSKEQRAYESIGEAVVKTYRAGECLTDSTKDNTTKAMFNVLWSNIQVLRPSLFARLPKIVVERMFKDSDPIGRVAASIAERATGYMLSSDEDRTKFAIKSAVEDRLLPGRGQVWLRYDCEFDVKKDEDGNPISEAKKPNTEKVCVDYVFWQDYFESAARNSYEVRWRAKRVYLTRAKLIEKFGEKIGKAVVLKGDKKKTKEEIEFFAEAEVFEIEDNDTKQRIWISDGYKKGALKVEADALRLKGFFSSPFPLLATTTTDSTYPTPDYKIYERLADELDYVTRRIQALVECIRVVGACAEHFYAELKQIVKKKDGDLVPVKAWAQLAEKGGFQGVIDWLPIEQAVKALGPLNDYQQSLINTINMITGIPDIAQGSTDPNETADAQQRKSHWAVVKLSDKQADVQRFCREIVSKMAEIIFEPGLFSDETIALMAGAAQMLPEDQQMFAPALQLLRDDRLRTFRVDIETDSTIAIDEDVDKQARMEYITAVNQLISNIEQISSFRPELMNPVIESALFAIRGFRTGRPVEGAWERALQLIEQNDKAAAEAAAQQPPPPDYEQMKIEVMGQQAQAQMIEAQAKQMEVQIKGQTASFNEWLKSQNLTLSQQEQAAQFYLDQTDQRLKEVQAQFEQAIETQRLEIEKVAVVMGEQEKLMEEARLRQEESMEIVRLMAEHSTAKVEAEAAATPPAPAPRPAPASPPVNITIEK